MSFALGTAVGRIVLDYDGKGVEEAKKDQTSLQKGSMSTQSALDKTAKGAGIAGGLIAAGLGVAVNSAANFEQRMSAIQAVSGATGDEFEGLRNKALQLGKDTQFSATDAASAIEELVKAGLSVPDVLNGAADAAVNLAAAGEIDIPQAATIAANAMNQFGLTAKQMPKVADAIAGAANASAIDVGQFGQSLQQVGAVAHLAGVDFHDTATAIAIMGNAGIAGSDAGTSLKTMFQRLQPTTKKQSEEMKRLGLITKDGSNQFYTAEGRTKSLAQVSQVLQNSLKGMSAQQKQAALQTLFGSDAIRGAAILSNAGAKGFDKMAKSMDKVKAADVAKARMDNFKGSLEQMKGSLETAGIAIGTVLLPFLRKLVDALTGAFNWFLNLNSGLQTAITVFAASAAAILLMVAAIIKIVKFAQEAKAAFLVLRAAIAETWLAALGPYLLIIAAIAAIIAIVVILYKKWAPFRNLVDAVWAAIKTAISAVVDWFQGVPDMFGNAIDAIQSFFSGLLDWLTSHWRLIITILLGPLGLAIALITKYWDNITGAFQAGIGAVRAVWDAFWNTFGGVITAAFGVVVALLNLAWVIIKGLFLLNLMAIQAVVTTVFNAIAAVVKDVWGVIVGIVRAALGLLMGIIRLELNGIKTVFQAVWNVIAAVLRAIWGRIGGTVTAGLNRARDAVVGAWNYVKDTTSRMWNAILDGIGKIVGNIADKLGEIKNKALDALAGAAKWLFDKGADIIQGLIDGMTSKLDDIKGAIGNITGKVSGWLPGSPVKEGPLRVLNQGYAGKQIINMIIDGITAQQGALEATVGDVAATIPAGMPVVSSRGGTITKKRKQGRQHMSVSGKLKLDDSGAYIEGLAYGVVDSDDDYDDTIDRMN
jgi:TP901 family phage tail tape measure protein